MQSLTLSIDSFDQENTFIVETQGFRRMKRMVVRLMQGYDRKDDGIFWGLQCSACLKAEYTKKDYAERYRLAEMTPVRKGDIVLINGEQYKANVLGDYSNCTIFEKV